MDYSDFLRKVYYVDSKKYILYAVYSTIIVIIVKIVSSISFFLVRDLINIFYVILLMTLNMLVMHSKVITGKKIYVVVNSFLWLLGLINLIGYIPDAYSEDLKKIIVDIGANKYNQFQYGSLLIIYYLVFKHRFKNTNKIYIDYFIMIQILMIILFFSNFKLIKYINLLIIILIIVVEYLKNKEKINFIDNKEKKMDILVLNLNVVIVDYFFSSICIIYNKYLIYEFIHFFVEIIMVTNLIIFIKRITKENYNFLFKETTNTNKNLEEINKILISNTKELEEAYTLLRKRKVAYQSFLNNVQDPIVILNENFRIIYGNSNFLKLISKDNIREILNRKINNYLNIEKMNFKNKEEGLWIQNIDFQEEKLEARIFNINNDCTEVICIFKNVTFEKKLDYKRKELQNIKIKENIKNNFLSNISHDLKIPINVIYSAIQLEKILIENNNIDKIYNYNQIIKDNCFILIKFTNNLIDISKIDSKMLEKKLVYNNIVKFIENYVDSLSTYIKSDGKEIVFDTSNEEVYIYFDKEMMQRVILNLISNALKFISDKGKIKIYIKDSENNVKIYFSDNGKGISKEFQKKIFNKYEMEKRTKDENKNGYGIGLFVVYNLIKEQGGDIEVRSKENKGASFIITMYK